MEWHCANTSAFSIYTRRGATWFSRHCAALDIFVFLLSLRRSSRERVPDILRDGRRKAQSNLQFFLLPFSSNHKIDPSDNESLPHVNVPTLSRFRLHGKDKCSKKVYRTNSSVCSIIAPWLPIKARQYLIKRKRESDHKTIFRLWDWPKNLINYTRFSTWPP